MQSYSSMIEKILNMTNQEKIEYTINKKRIEVVKQLIDIWLANNENKETSPNFGERNN
jgi:hypothetical protein